MKFKKLWAMLLVFAMLVPAQNVIAATSDTPDEVEYWQSVKIQGDDGAIYKVQTCDELSDRNDTDTTGKRESGKPVEDVRYVVVNNYDEVTNSYYDFNDYNEVSGSSYNITPTYYDEVSNGGYVVTPEPTPYDEVSGSGYVVTPEPTSSPTPYQNPTSAPIPTVKPTPYQNPVTTPVVRPDPSGIVYVTPEVKTPQKVTYDVDLEVGRLAHIKPEKATQDTRKSSNTGIINDPRLATGTFNVEYEARANKPGDATLTFGTSKENFTEEWNVHVYCRPLDFEKTEYVVEKKAGKDGYITLYLKYFEYEYEYAYNFEWSSSDKDVAYLAGGTYTTTFARFCVKKPGITIITVKDKYGNSSQCALVVKDAEKAQATPEPTPKPTATPKPTKAPTPEPTAEVTATPKPTKTPKVTATPTPTAEPTATPKPTKAPKPTATPTEEPLADGITEAQIKQMVKETKVSLKVKSEAGKIVLDFSATDELVYRQFLKGFQVQVKGPGMKKFVTIEWKEFDAAAFSYLSDEEFNEAKKITVNFTDGKNKKKYQFRVRGYYVTGAGKKVYTKWSKTRKTKFSKKGSK